MASVADATERRDALVERLSLDAIGAFDLFLVHIGRGSASTGRSPTRPLTSSERLRRGSWHPRAVRTGVARAAGGERPPRAGARRTRQRRFRLAGGARRGAARRLEPQLHRADGARRPGLDPSDRRAARGVQRTAAACRMPTTARTCTRPRLRFTRPLFENLLGKEWLRSVPEIHERLLADPPARA